MFRLWRDRSLVGRGCIVLVMVAAACIFCSIAILIGVEVGLLPDVSATETAEAKATAAILALTPSSTPTNTPTSTATFTPTLTPLATNTPSLTPTLIPSATPRPTYTSTPVPTNTFLPSESARTWYLLDEAPFYACPSLGCEVLFTAEEGSEISPVETSGEWHKVIAVDGTVAYVGLFHTSLRSPAAATPGPTSLPVTPETGVVYTIGNANLRPCPQASDGCAPIEQVGGGEVLSVTGHITGQVIGGNALWYEVQRGARTAFIHSSLVSKNQPAAIQPPAVEPGPVGGPTRAPTESGSICTQYQRPSNCDQATSYGLSGEQIAACWPHLDRNKNGTACYGS